MHTIVALALLVHLGAMASPTDQRTLLFDHSGATDPTTEGWTQTVGNDTSVGPLDDAGTPAWYVYDDGTGSGSGGGYAMGLTIQQFQHALEHGWVLRASLRVPRANETPDGSPMVFFRDGSRSFQLHFGSTSGGDQVVKVVDGFHPTAGAAYTVPNDGYNLYEMVYDPATETVDVFVNGAEVISDYAGVVWPSIGMVAFGAASPEDSGRANFNLVEFYLVDSAVSTSETSWGALKAGYR